MIGSQVTCCTLAYHGLAVEVGELHALRGDDGEVAIGKEEQIAGVIKNGGDIGGDEVFVLAQADDGGRAVAGGDDLVGLIHRDHGQREYAGQIAHRLAHGFFQRGAVAVAGF